MNALPKRLPTSLHQFFWDIDATTLDPGKHPTYVINRLLDKGNLEAARWVLAHFPKETIVETLKTRRDFSPWNAVFWGRFMEVPREEMRCLDPSYLRMRKMHWPY